MLTAQPSGRTSISLAVKAVSGQRTVCRRSAGRLLGPENVLELTEPSLGTDDFGYFSEGVRGCYYYVGVGSETKGFTAPNHNPRFAADPEALPLAAAVHVQCVLDFLR